MFDVSGKILLKVPHLPEEFLNSHTRDTPIMVEYSSDQRNIVPVVFFVDRETSKRMGEALIMTSEGKRHT